MKPALGFIRVSSVATIPEAVKNGTFFGKRSYLRAVVELESSRVSSLTTDNYFLHNRKYSLCFSRCLTNKYVITKKTANPLRQYQRLESTGTNCLIDTSTA